MCGSRYSVERPWDKWRGLGPDEGDIVDFVPACSNISTLGCELSPRRRPSWQPVAEHESALVLLGQRGSRKRWVLVPFVRIWRRRYNETGRGRAG